MDKNYLVLVIKYKNKIYAFNRKNKYTFPIISVNDFTDLTSSSVLISDYFNNRAVPDFVIEGSSDIIELFEKNNHLNIKYVIIKIKKQFNLLSNEIMIPYYYLYKKYFNKISRIFINWYNSLYLINDLPIDARILFSIMYFKTNEDYYLNILSYTKNILSKVNSGINDENDAVNYYFKKNYNEFILNNKEIFRKAIIINYAYYDKNLR